MPGSPRHVRWVSCVATALLGAAATVVAAPLPAQAASTVAASTVAASTVAVNGATTYQTITGFGVSEAFGQANAIRNVGNATVQAQMLTMLFSTSGGAGFSILRNLIPSDAAHTMEPTKPSSPSAIPAYVWDGSSDATDWGQLWLAKKAKTYGVTTFYNDAWSAPAFMKTNASETNGGYLCGVPGETCGNDWRQAYANYLVQHSKNWASVGVAPSYLGFVNEPSYSTGYSSMLMTPAQAANFLTVLGPTVKSAGLATKITCCDTLGWNLLPGYVSAIGANANLGVYTSHGYSSAPASSISTGGKPVWESEWSTGSGTFNTAWDDGSAQSGYTWAQHLFDGLTKANLNAFFYWWGVSSSSGSNGSLVLLNGTSLTVAKRYYSFVNFSRFVRPGAVRIAATGSSGLGAAAFRNTDGSVVVVVLNSASGSASTTYTLSGTGKASGTVTPYLTNAGNSAAPQSTISLSGGSFTATVPARSLVTYRIP